MTHDQEPHEVILEESDSEEQPQRRRRLIGISLLPSAATLGNLLCGFLALTCCLLSIRAEYTETFAVQPRVFFPRIDQVFPTHIAVGAYLLVLAMIFDALDGRLARMVRRTSEFGAQLDSIADIVSFGVAPVALFLTLLMRPEIEAVEEVPEASRVLWRMSILSVLVYVSCAAIRLARYNAENVRDESAQKKFSGLPTPGAAAALIALLILHESLYAKELGGAATVWTVDWAGVVRWVIAVFTFGLGILMVSRLDYVHVFNMYVRRHHPPTHLVWLLVVVGLAWYSPPVLLVVLAYAYVISGLVLNIRRRRRRLADGE